MLAHDNIRIFDSDHIDFVTKTRLPMIDLTAAFKDALSRKQEWGYEQASQLAHDLSESAAGSVRGSATGNWMWVDKDGETAALVYHLAPLVGARDDLVNDARDVLRGVTVMTGLKDYGDVAFRLNERDAQDLLPYPADEIKLDWDGFSLWDFVYETT